MRTIMKMAGLVFALGWSAVAAQAAERLPNIILISVDAMRPDHMSCYGYGRATTPNLDRFARQGVRFLDASSSIPLTNPAIVSLFSSRLPYETDAIRNGIPYRPEIEVLPQMLRAAGYNTAAAVASWPLQRPRSGLAQHFDFYEDRLRDKPLQGYPMEREAQWTTEQGQKILRAGLHEPFFYWTHYADPHQPHDLMPGFTFPPDPSGKITKVMDAYDSELAYTDHWIGVLLKDFEDRGLLNANTLVIIMADHGESLGEKPFIGHGRKLYQTILRIPFVMCGPGLPVDKDISTPIHMLDISPTILAYLGLPSGAAMEGRNLMPLIRDGQEPPIVPMFFETYGVAVFNIFPGIRALAARSRPSVMAMRIDNLKIMYAFGSRAWQMYDLNSDPAEDHNLAPQDPNFMRLAEQLRDFYAKRDRTPLPELPSR